MSGSELSEMLKSGTKESHSKAENTNFMKGFLRGELSMDEFKVCGFPFSRRVYTPLFEGAFCKMTCLYAAADNDDDGDGDSFFHTKYHALIKRHCFLSSPISCSV